jgi:hypothetical protein
MRKKVANIPNKKKGITFITSVSTWRFFGCDLHSYSRYILRENIYFIVSLFSCVWLFNSTPTARLHGMTLCKRRFDVLQDELHVGFLLVNEAL